MVRYAKLVSVLVACVAFFGCWSAPIPSLRVTDGDGTCYDDMLENDVHPLWKPTENADGSHVFAMIVDSPRYPNSGYGFQWSNVKTDEGQHCFHFALQGTYPAFIIEEVSIGLWPNADSVPTTGSDMWNAQFSYYNSVSNTGVVCPDQIMISDCTDLSEMVVVFGGYGRDRGGGEDVEIRPDPQSCPLVTPGSLNACEIDVDWNAGVNTPTPTPSLTLIATAV